MNVIAIIPARGGSKGILRKNLQVLGEQPLLVHSISQAHQTQHIQQVFVSTDDAEIAQVARDAGATVVMRPPALSGDTAASEDALLHVVEQINSADLPDLIVFLQCTSPIRRPNDIDDAIQTLIDEEADSLLSVAPFHLFLWQRGAQSAEPLDYDYRQRPRRQDRHPEFIENGSIYVFKPWVLQQFKNRLGGKIALYEMHEWSLIDINESADLDLCRIVWEQWQR